MVNWKPIPGFEGFEASDEGHIRNTNSGKQLNEYQINSGYLIASCAGYGNQLVHRLVCMAFHPDGIHDNQVNHINGIPTDNRPENLEFMSLGDNVRDFWNNPIFTEKQNRVKQQVSERMSSRIWVTDGVTSYRIRPEDMPNYPTFHKGRTYHRKEVTA